MRLYLSGHEYKYAVEQMLLTLFPHERPEYPEGRPGGDRMEIALSRGRQRTTACCVYRRGAERFCGRAVELCLEADEKLKTSYDSPERVLDMLVLELAGESRNG